MDAMIVNTVINAVALILVAAIGAAARMKMNRLQAKTELIDESVRVKLEQILWLNSRADLAEGAEIGRLRAIAEAAAVEAARVVIAEHAARKKGNE